MAAPMNNFLDRRGWGRLMMIGGGVMAAYFWLVFNVAVPMQDPFTKETIYIVNMGLSQDRLIGTIISIAIVIVGAVLAFSSYEAPSAPAAAQLPPPPNPAAFPMASAPTCLGYAPPPQSLATMSEVMWLRTLATCDNPALFTRDQIQWGYHWGITPSDFRDCVNHVEAVRAWKGRPKSFRLLN